VPHLVMEEVRADPGLRRWDLDALPLLGRLKSEFLGRKPCVCVERARYVTEAMRAQDPAEPMVVRRAKAVRHFLACRKAVFHDDNLLAGSTTSQSLGAPVYPELMGISVWPELDTISTRKANPQQLSREDGEILNLEVFPYWMDRTVLEVTRRELEQQGGRDLESLRLMERVAFFMAGKSAVISHTTPFYEEVLARGISAMMEDARGREAWAAAAGSGPGKVAFYQATRIALQGILDYAQNLSSQARKSSELAPTNEARANLAEMARVCAKVPAGPAETLREAANALWLCHVGVLAENVNMAMNPGRLDQVLYPYLLNDLRARRLTVEDALTLLGCLWLKIGDNTNLVPQAAESMFGGAGSVPAVTLGGVDKQGRDAVNDLTYMMLRVTELLAIRDPNVNARYHPGVNDATYLERACRVVVATRAIPALYNDVCNIATLVNQGVSLEHARDYAIVGCVEPGSAGREYASTSSILLNLSAAMDLTLHNGRRPYLTGDQQIGPRTGEPGDLRTFDEFQAAFETQLRSLVERVIGVNEALGKTHQRLLPTPLLSCFFEGPAQKGMDLSEGGALYNSSGATHVAFADVCDSLNAIEDAVYRRGLLTLEELRKAAGEDFEGEQRLLGYLRNEAPKFGQDDSLAPSPVSTKNSQRLIRFLYDTFQGHTNYRGGKYRTAFWTMTNHAGLGRIGAALPSGRKAHAVFSSGITPSSQCVKDLTGLLNSVAALDSRLMPGGVALNIKYTPPPGGADGEYIARFRHYVEGYFRSGGMQVQFNIQDYETLARARLNPDEFRYLIVRVSGYSAFFRDLNPAMQEELIRRSQFDVSTGKLVSYSGEAARGLQPGDSQ